MSENVKSLYRLVDGLFGDASNSILIFNLRSAASSGLLRHLQLTTGGCELNDLYLVSDENSGRG